MLPPVREVEEVGMPPELSDVHDEVKEPQPQADSDVPLPKSRQPKPERTNEGVRS